MGMELTAGRDQAGRTTGTAGVVLWSIAGFALYVVLGVASIFVTLVFDPVLEAAGLRVEAGELGLSVRNALHPPVWGLLVAGAAIPIGRRLVAGVRFSRASWLVLGAGLVLATVTWLLIEEFVRSRMSSFDPEYVGFTILTYPALVAVAVLGWAAAAVPRGVGGPLLLLLALAVVGLAVALIPSIPGVADGIEPHSLPLAVVFMVDVAYVVGVLAFCFRMAGSTASG
jgi:hypothetical protein